MMRGKCAMATAVRDGDGNVQVESERLTPPEKRSRFSRLPFVRGVVNFVNSLVVGNRVLMRSAEVAEGDDEQPSKAEKWLAEKHKINLNALLNGAATILGIVLAVLIFVLVPQALTQLTGFHLTRGMLCAMRRPALPEAGALCRAARRVVVLENVMNPTNLGAIFRSAAALNMDAVLLTEAGSDPLYRRAVRVSMGTVFQIPWTYLPDGWPEPSMGWLRAQGFRTVAMALRDDSVPLNDPRLLAEERLAIVLGTEGDGLAQATIDACDYTVRIPMSHGVDSLNVAAASAVAFYQLGLQ